MEIKRRMEKVKVGQETEKSQRNGVSEGDTFERPSTVGLWLTLYARCSCSMYWALSGLQGVPRMPISAFSPCAQSCRSHSSIWSFQALWPTSSDSLLLTGLSS